MKNVSGLRAMHDLVEGNVRNLSSLSVPSYIYGTPSIETQLAVVRGLPTKNFQTDCVNEKSSTERRS